MSEVKNLQEKIIGITGGIASGKSTVAGYLRDEYDAGVLMADEIAHEVYKKNTPEYNLIVERYGKDLLLPDDSMDRGKLADIIFNDKEQREFIDSIVHPFVFRRIEAEIVRWRGMKDAPFLVIETALMFDTGCDRYCDEVWGIITKRDIRIERLMTTRGYSRDKAKSIISAQISDDELIERCDRIIYNDGSMHDLMRGIA